MNNIAMDNLKKIIVYNAQKSKENNKIMNSFKNLFDLLVQNVEYDNMTYDEIMSNNNARMKFLMDAANIGLYSSLNDDMKKIVLQSFEILFYYLSGETSEFKELSIPSEISDSAFKDYMPSEIELQYLLTLITANNQIFKEEFEGKSFSQRLNEGFHSNIKEILEIKKDKISHLLGLTSNSNSLYAFYKKNIIDSAIMKIIETMGTKKEMIFDSNYNFKNNEKLNNDFKKMFINIFSIEFTKENYLEMINSRYVTKNSDEIDEKTKIFNKICDFIPKSTTIDFYSNSENMNLLIEECHKNNLFVTKYVYENKLKNKNLKQLKKVFTDEEIDMLKNNFNELSHEQQYSFVNKYLKENTIKNNKNFQNEFKRQFSYSYPLIEFNKILGKNISFYNFSLFENLNSIIVDFTPHGNIHSDLFLVSYPSQKMEIQKSKVAKRIKTDFEIHNDTDNDISDNNLDNNYLNLLKSLLQFPPEDRYYFRQMDNIEINRQNQVMRDTFSKENCISMFGFASKESELERLELMAKQENGELKEISHFHHCETNIPTNFLEYYTKWRQSGIEYPIDHIVEEGSGKIKTITKIYDDINNQINIFNNFKYNNFDIKESINYEKNIINNIKSLIKNYNDIKKVSLNVYKYKNELNINIINEQNKLLIYDNYYQKIDKYFDNYLNIINNEQLKNNTNKYK